MTDCMRRASSECQDTGIETLTELDIFHLIIFTGPAWHTEPLRAKIELAKRCQPTLGWQASYNSGTEVIAARS